jgi:hypothetical protein
VAVVRDHLLQPAVHARQRDALVEYLENRSCRAVVRSRKSAIVAAYSPRRYLHIEAVFVFGGRLDHWSAASGQARRQTRNIHNRKKRNSNMKTMTRFLVVSRQSRTKLAAVALAGLLGAVLSVSDANAFSCARSAFGAGCIGARGAVGLNRNGAVVVGRYGNAYAYHRGSVCYWHNNQRICP